MSLFSNKRNYNTAYVQPVDPEKAEDYEKDFTESFLDNWHFQTYTANSYSRTDNFHDEFKKDIALIEQKTGQKLKNPYKSAFEEFFVEDVALGLLDEMVRNPFNQKSSRYTPEKVKQREEQRVNEYYQKVNELKKNYPDLNVRDYETIKNDIKNQALEYYQKVNDGRNSSGLGDFLGAAAGTMVDPINAAATFISGGASGAAKTTLGTALAKTAVGEFVINSGIEAVIQPSVYNYKKELDLPYSKTEAAMNVLAAGVGGAVLGTTAKALNMGGKELLAKYKNAKAKGVKFDAKAKEAAAMLENQIEFDDWAARTNPLDDAPETLELHKRSVLEAERRLTEEADIAAGYDSVLKEPNGDPMEILAEIKPEDMETVWINRGGHKNHNNVKGSGFGMVKFAWKHGKLGKDSIPIEKSDVVNFPTVIRDYEPVINDTYGSNRTWSVKRADGKQIIYADRVFKEDGNRHLVTIHIVTNKEHKLNGVFSERRRTRPAVHTMDTTQKTFSRTDESLAETSAPKSRFHGGGDAMDNIISPEAPKVKDYEGISFDALEREIDDDIKLSADDKTLAKEKIGQMRREESWDNEIIDCILEFKQR